MDDSNNPFTSIKDALKDEKRIKYHNDYLSNLLASINTDTSPRAPYQCQTRVGHGHASDTQLTRV
ncbi:hypothetical protein CsSME_00043512 [Camellia sinensis var. sinensis]